MKVKRVLFTGLLALLVISTAYAAYNFSGGSIFQGRFPNPFSAAFAEAFAITVEMPSSDNEDYSYKHPVMFRARVQEAGSATDLSQAKHLKYKWESDRQGLIGESYEFEKKLSKGTHLITCTVNDSNGKNGKTVRTVNIINMNPVVTIKAPAHDSSIKAAEPLMLKADVSDLEENVLPETSVTWESNVDGYLGRGKSLMIENASKGEHRVTVRVRDSEGGEAEDSININIL